MHGFIFKVSCVKYDIVAVVLSNIKKYMQGMHNTMIGKFWYFLWTNLIQINLFVASRFCFCRYKLNMIFLQKFYCTIAYPNSLIHNGQFQCLAKFLLKHEKQNHHHS